ncbi:unknown [Acetobacter sp. CAG:977]|nr:unknown [Acetobacter sp. CAG:977]
MAETEKKPENEKSLLEQFMAAGKVTVFESGLERPDYIQDRPFFNLLPRGKTSVIEAGEKPNSLTVTSGEQKGKSPSLRTEAHQFFVEMEKRFRSVVPGITVFIIDPDAVQGRYLMDEKEDRSLGKSLFLHVEQKLRAAKADKEKTFLTDRSVLKQVSEAGITGRNPFSMAASVSPTYDALEGVGRVNLVVGDNPDSMEPNVLGDAVVGADERMAKEGITPDEFRRLVLYHELGHATDEEYTGYSFDKITQNELSDVMRRHRTECIADAHATLQLARDFGNTKCAALWGDCRIEYLRVCVNNRLEDTKYESDFVKKLREAEEKTTGINPDDPEYERKYKQLMQDKKTSAIVTKLGSPLAYHTTDVVDAAIKFAEEHLKDGSLQKMTDAEVIKEARRLSETYGLTRQQMAEISIALAEGKPHPKYEQMMARCDEARSRMPLSKEAIEKEYELRRELRAFQQEAQLAANLGLPQPDPNKSLSKDLLRKLIREQSRNKQMQTYAQIVLMDYQDAIFDAFESKGFSRKAMHQVISQQKEALRKAGHDPVKPDKFAPYKLKTLDAIIQEAPDVQTSLNANKIVKDKLASMPSKTEVSGTEALAHFVKNELRSLNLMKDVLAKALIRDPAKLTVDEQIECLRSERKDFVKAMQCEKETQIAAFALRSDKDMWALVSKNEVLAALVDNKAKQKPAVWFAQYQMMAGKPDKKMAEALMQGIIQQHQYVASSVVASEGLAPALEKEDKRMMKSLKNYVSLMEKSSVPKQKKISPLGLKQVKDGKTV